MFPLNQSGIHLIPSVPSEHFCFGLKPNLLRPNWSPLASLASREARRRAAQRLQETLQARSRSRSKWSPRVSRVSRGRSRGRGLQKTSCVGLDTLVGLKRWLEGHQCPYSRHGGRAVRVWAENPPLAGGAGKECRKKLER